ncbi:hypothetical protein [Streptomyces sp. NPDC001781]
MRRGARPAVRAVRAVALASAALLLAGCAQSVDPIERLGKKAAQGVRHPVPVSEVAYRHWGLAAPLAAPPRHAGRPLSRRAGTRVWDHVATADRVVFLTYDVPVAQDRSLAALVGELRLPVTVLPRARERRGPCTAHARLLRAHATAYDPATLRAAAACGVTALVHWRAETSRRGLVFRGAPGHLTPGDIVRVTPDRRGGLAGRTARVLREAQARGLTAGKLTDYL